MSSVIATSSPAASTSGSPSQGSAATDDVRLTFPRIIRSEWIKLATLRSTKWTLAITFAVIVGIVTLFAAILASQAVAGNVQNVDGTGSIFVFSIAAMPAELAVTVLGVLVISGEYTTGMIRSTLVAVPQRLLVLWAKAIVLAASVFGLSAVAVGVSLGVLQLFLGSTGLAPHFSDQGTVRILVGVPLYLTAIALLAFATGALLRHSAGALAAVLGLLLVIENLFLVPWKPFQLIHPFLPGAAGSRIIMPQAQMDAVSVGAVGANLGPWQAYGVLLAWVAVLLSAAAVLLRRRNA
jgi:ABC-2 type transport system permease protein